MKSNPCNPEKKLHRVTFYSLNNTKVTQAMCLTPWNNVFLIPIPISLLTCSIRKHVYDIHMYVLWQGAYSKKTCQRKEVRG